MTHKEFKKILKDDDIKHYVYRSWLIISKYNWNFDVYFLGSIPSNTKFCNEAHVWLDALTSIPKNTIFDNGGYVWLNAKASQTMKNAKFNQGGGIFLVSYHKSSFDDEHGTKLMFDFEPDPNKKFF